MASIKTITQKINAWRRYRDVVRELSHMTETTSLAISALAAATLDTSLVSPSPARLR
jgi:hypothetical protein